MVEPCPSSHGTRSDGNPGNVGQGLVSQTAPPLLTGHHQAVPGKGGLLYQAKKCLFFLAVSFIVQQYSHSNFISVLTNTWLCSIKSIDIPRFPIPVMTYTWSSKCPLWNILLVYKIMTSDFYRPFDIPPSWYLIL